MDKKEYQELKSFINSIQREFKPIKILLFGSRARGDFLDDSDYDILIVSKTFEGVTFPDRITSVLMLLKDPIDIEVICLTPKEFEKKSKQLTIIAEAVREGIELHAEI